MAQNMESLLMGGDDSSSGESDDEVNVPMSTATTAASTVAAPRQVAAPKPAQIPPSRGKPGASNNQMSRLKNLYSMSKAPAPKPLQQPPMQQQQQQRPSQRPAPAPIQAPPQQQQQRARPQQQQQMQQRPMHQPTSHQTAAQQQQHKRSQLYQQSQQQKQQQQQQQQMQSRPQTQQRQPQYAQPASQQRQQYSQPPQQQPMQSRPQTQPRQSQYPKSTSQSRPQYSQQPQQRSQPQSSRGSSSQPPSQQVPVDPFAPTPLSQIKQGSSHSRRTHPQQQVQRPSSQPVRTQQIAGSSSGTTPTSHQEMKRNKEKFLMFTRVLIKYLEQKDPRMHAQAKSIIKDCAERNKRQEPGYESVTLSMKRRLRDLVGDHYWKKANDYLVHFIEQKKRQAGLAGRSSGSGSISASQQAKEEMRRRQQQQQQLQRQRQQQEAQRRAQAQKLKKETPKPRTSAAPSIADVRKGIQDKREQLASQDSSTTAKAATASKAKKTTPASKDSKTTTTAKKTTTKKVTRRKSTGDASTSSRKSTTTKASTTSTTTVIKKIVIEEPPREYKELMELIDHSVEYDWPSIGQLLGNKADLKLSDEELQLLYGDNPPESLVKKKTTKTPTKPAEPTTSTSTPEDADEPKEDVKPVDGIRPGWSQTNILSARAAWARVRWKEVKQRKMEMANSAPVVADGLLTLPTPQPAPAEPEKQPEAEKPAAAPTPTAAVTSTSTPATPTATPSTPEAAETPVTPKPVIEGSWFNDETAEQDKALALLSEGCQIYLKGVLEKAVQCARQRQNLDGIRLWHQQHAFGKGVSSITTSDSKNKSVDKSKKPPLALRLGCDVSRQAAQAQGNAALTVKRMEEALDRQTGIPMRVRQLNEETLMEATSMGDLAWRPLLKKGAEKADLQAKRAFEVYGGRESKDPPLGRVPKKAKLLVQDFVMGAELTLEGPYHKAYTASSFLSF